MNVELFDNIHNDIFDGWGFSFRRSQIFRFSQYIRAIENLDINGNVLEIGCSTGFFSYNYLHKLYENRLTCCDISEIAIQKAKNKYERVNFEIGALPKTGYKDKQFKLVTIMEVIYYLSLEDQIKSIDEIYRILDNSGFVVISVNIGPKPYFTAEEIEKLVEPKFNIIYRDSLYIKGYYNKIETKLWILLLAVSKLEKISIHKSDKVFKKVIKKLANIFVRNKIFYYTIGILLRKTIKIALYIMPIRLINIISKKIDKDNQRSLYFFIAQKVN